MASTVWRGYITFGLISIPVRLFRAARAERVSLRRLYREEMPSEEPSHPATLDSKSVGGASRRNQKQLHLVRPDAEAQKAPIVELTPVQQVSIRKGSDQILPAQAVVKGYEYEKNRFVALEPEELKNAAAQTSTEMQIQEFVKLAEIDPVYFETSYYVSPEEAGEKAYALLYRSMQTTGLVALAQFAMHSREHVVALRPGRTGILAHTMFFTSEVRADEEYRADVSVVANRELELAQTLIHSLAAPFEPEKYRDTYRERLEALIAAKVRGQPAAAPQKAEPQPQVIDIAEALRKSLANLKKPAASDEHSRKLADTTSRKPKRSSHSAGRH